MRDVIEIVGLELQAHIGATESERAKPQRLTVNATLHPTRSFRELDDRLENTIDYARVCQIVHELAAENRCKLIETLAAQFAAGVISHFPACAAVDIELRKYALSDTAYVAARHSLARQTSI